MDMEQIAEHEKLLGYVGQYLPDDVNLADVDLDAFRSQAPALFHLLQLKAQGRLADARTATDEYLRDLDEDLFDNLVALALTFNRRGGIEFSENWGRELFWVSFELWRDERREGMSLEVTASAEEQFAIVKRFVDLILLEERRRRGDFEWVEKYTLLRRVSEDSPRRIATRWSATEH